MADDDDDDDDSDRVIPWTAFASSRSKIASFYLKPIPV